MNTQLNTTQVVAWLREKSTIYRDMADQLEKEIGSPLPGSTEQAPRSRLQLRSNDAPTPEEVKSRMAGRSVRIASLAKEMGLLESVLESLMTEANGFVRGERGWIGTLTNNARTAGHHSDTHLEGGDL